MSRTATGRVTGNIYVFDALGRAMVDTTDAPFLLSTGTVEIDGPVGMGFYSGSGAPTFNAIAGSLYARTDGSSSSTRLYLNTSTLQGTTWIAISTAS